MCVIVYILLPKKVDYMLVFLRFTQVPTYTMSMVNYWSYLYLTILLGLLLVTTNINQYLPSLSEMARHKIVFLLHPSAAFQNSWWVRKMVQQMKMDLFSFAGNL